MRTTLVTCDRCSKVVQPAEASVQLEGARNGHSMVAIERDLCGEHYEELRDWLTTREAPQENEVVPPPIPLPQDKVLVKSESKGAIVTEVRPSMLEHTSKRRRHMDERLWAPREEAMMKLLHEAGGVPITHWELAIILGQPAHTAGETMRRLWRRGHVIKVSGGARAKWKLA